MYVYADNAATTPMSGTAMRAVEEAMRSLWGNPSSLHGTGQRAAAALADCRSRMAGCLGAQSPDEIVFTGGGSEADNQAIRSAAYTGARNGKKHIVSTAFEHHAVLRTLDALAGEGFEITLLPVGGNGVVDPDDVRAAIRPDTALVSVMYANNEIGTIQPIREIGRVCRERGVLFHTDAVQAVGRIPVDVTADFVDLLSLSAHKFHGPKGVGALYVRHGTDVLPLILGGGQESGRRAGTENLPGIAGMSAALCEAVSGLPETRVRVAALRDRLVKSLTDAIPGTVLNGTADRDKRLPGTVSLCFEGVSGEAVVLRADMAGIALSAGSACTSGCLEPSHVMTAIGRDPTLALGAVRISLSGQTTEAEVSYIADTLPVIISALRK
ncbi:MAG: cysteine desulfurase [Clostridia bacterium]|nr:cysteine desulfurase [Clostridia bacterium]